MSSFSDILVSAQSSLDKFVMGNYSTPLSTSYPTSNGYVTSPSSDRVVQSTTGDPRATAGAGYVNIYSGDGTQSLADALGAPVVNIGGSTYSSTGGNIPITVWVALAVVAIYLIFFRK